MFYLQRNNNLINNSQIAFSLVKNISFCLFRILFKVSFLTFAFSDSPFQPDCPTTAKMKRTEPQQDAKESKINSDIMKEKLPSEFVRLAAKKTENTRKPIKLKRKRSNSKQDEQKRDTSMTEQCNEEGAGAKKSCPPITGSDNCDASENINTVIRTDNNQTTNSINES